MPNSKISALPSVTTIGNTDTVPVVQGGATKSATVLQLLASVFGANPPAALDTLRELADAIGDDPNYATNLVTALAGKAPVMTATGVKTTAYTANPNEIVPVDATAGTVPITVPTAPADRTRVTVKKIDTTTNTVTIATGGTDVLNKAGGSTGATLALLNQSTTVQYAAAAGIWYVIASDTPLSQLDTRYTDRDTLVFYDDFTTKPNGNLNGVTPTLGGSPWVVSGAQPFTISGGKIASTGTSYAQQSFASQPVKIYADIIWAAGTGSAPTATLICTKDTDLSITNAVHAVFSTTACTVTLRSGGQTTFDPFFVIVWTKPMVADSTTRYRIAITIQGDTVTVFGPNGEIGSAVNAKVSKLAGKQAIWETQANSAGAIVPQFAAVGAMTRNGARAFAGPFVSPTDAAGAGQFAGPFGQAVGSKGQFGEASVGRTSNGYPGAAFGSSLVMGYLGADTAAGATSITTDKAIPNGSSVRIGVYPNQDVVTSSAASTGTGPYTTTVPALTYAHTAGDAVDATPSATARAEMYHNVNNGNFYLPNVPVLVAPGGKLYLGTTLTCWIDAGGNNTVEVNNPLRLKAYTTVLRNALGLNAGNAGSNVYDTDLGKPIWWSGTAWKDAAGTTV